jgi:hypothetical protein
MSVWIMIVLVNAMAAMQMATPTISMNMRTATRKFGESWEER